MPRGETPAAGMRRIGARPDQLGLPAELMGRCQERLEQLRLQAEVQQVNRSRTTQCAAVVMEAIEAAAQTLELPCQRLPSRAGHDALYVAPTGPVGMVFIP